MSSLRAPFPYFGGKRRVADAVWARLGDTPNYVEPFAGSAAVLLARPDSHEWWDRVETINDASGYISNAWRAIRLAPDAVAEAADWPVDETMLHARHVALVGQRSELVERLEADPEWCDPRAAGWWIWGACCSIGGGWCAGGGPWQVVDGRLVRGAAGKGVQRNLPHLGDSGQGVHRKLPHLGSSGQGVHRKLPNLDWGKCLLSWDRFRKTASVTRQLPHQGPLAGVTAMWADHLRATMAALSDRLRRVRITCGDWSRVCGPTPTVRRGEPTAVFLDPPYSAERSKVYEVDSSTVAHEVRDWVLERGDDPRYRIALCGYEGEHDMPDSWECYAWKSAGGYGSRARGRGRENSARERIWFSPHCLRPARQMELFEEEG